ncbi:MAG: deoxyribodipyrimidine photo-lyase [Cytophagales bacterium]
MNKISIFWFRRDLRLQDNIGIYEALKNSDTVIPVFIFDTEILQHLPQTDSRVNFIYNALQKLDQHIDAEVSKLNVYYGKPHELWPQIIKEHQPNSVFCNHDYEPNAISRDLEIENICSNAGVQFVTYKDQCIFEKNQVVKDDGKPYTVFTPYSKKWLAALQQHPIETVDSENYKHKFNKPSQNKLRPITDYGFSKINLPELKDTVTDTILKNYAENRDFPAISGTSRLGVHLRFGTISIRQLALKALQANSPIYLNELIWRDFYMMILWHFPQVVKKSFKPQYEQIAWRNDPQEFEKWCNGNTGYPIIDAGMRELNTTGYMHNRVRMIVASFLTKHLLIDWRWGEAYFAQKLLDYDLAANNGGWQWAAGSGCDAAPYFRVFNPSLQTQKFDPKLEYIRKWVPEWQTFNYTKPIVDHDFARKRALEVYKKGLNE